MAGDLVRYAQDEVILPARPVDWPKREVATAGPGWALPFAAMFEQGFARAHSAEHRILLTAWIGEREEWLKSKTAISGSTSTRRTYICAIDTFWMWLGADPLLVKDERRRLGYVRDLAVRQVAPDEYRAPWTVAAGDAAQYRLWLEETGKSVATTAHYMAVASSFFQYVIDKADIGSSGVEASLFVDARGVTRRNPFRNRAVQRPKVVPYGKAEPLSVAQVKAFMRAIQNEARALVRARDAALFLTYLVTGRRASEIVGMRWGDIREGEGAGTWEFRFVGKGHGRGLGADADWNWQALPGPCYHSIVGWLREAGRWEGITSDDFIFSPISDEGTKNFAPDVAEKRHIAARRVGQLMDKIAVRAGLGDVHPHQLRHTFAHHLYELTKDIRLVSELLGHKSIATTQIYIGRMERKQDSYSAALMQQMGLPYEPFC